MTGKKILLAEDSAVTQDILKLILSQRGHTIDSAEDGPETLQMLRENEYDIALIDYHLPKMTGLEALNLFLKDKKNELVPKLVAITGDVEALLGSDSNCEYFDLILAKPLGIDDVVPVVEADDACPRLFLPPDVGADTSSSEKIEIAVPFTDTDLLFVYYPRDFVRGNLDKQTKQRLSFQKFADAVICLSPPSKDERAAIFRQPELIAVPVVDLSSSMKAQVEVCKKEHEISSQTIIEIAQEFKAKRGLIHPDLLFPETDDERLLVRAYICGSQLTPKYDPESRKCVSYNSILDPTEVSNIAERLVQQGILEKTFFDRFFTCFSCQSNRLAVREECPACKSPHLTQESYIHHYRCAYQAPEEKFRRGDLLVCPKCSRELVHFGGDYDKPGSQLVCQVCSHSATDPSIGFICLDCGAHADGETISQQDVYSFKITNFGEELLQSGRVVTGKLSKSLRFSDLPLDFIMEINAAARAFSNDGNEFCIISVAYKNQHQLERTDGIDNVSKAREEFIGLLREALSTNGLISTSRTQDYLLITGTSYAEIDAKLQGAVTSIQSRLNLDLEPIATTLDPDELSEW